MQLITVKSVNSALASTENNPYLSPVKFSYNYLNKAPAYLNAKSLQPLVTRHLTNAVDTRPHFTTANAFTLDPHAAGLPWPTGLTCIRQSKFWKSGLSISTELLQLFAKDEVINRTVRSDGKSLGSIAAHELQLEEEDRFTKFATYLFPEADEERMRLLAATIVYIVIFDDAWEMVEGNALKDVRDDFLQRLQSRHAHDKESCTELQALINSTIDGFHGHDAISGNGGQEVIDRLVDFCNHVPPKKKFETLGDYLTYRRIDAGVPYILACVKFSIASNVDIESSQLERFLRLISDHVSIVNDIASYDKEKKAFRTGKTYHLINAVDVVQRLFSLPTEDAAKALAYATQLEIEVELEQELERMKAIGSLTTNEWHFVDAVLTMTTGNVFYSIVSSRYGGESTRILE